MSDVSFQVLFQILTTEQELLKRSDQKAFTLLSTLAVFMVFFIVHSKNLPMNVFLLVLIFLYFGSAMMTILLLLRVIVPRLKNLSVPAAEQVMPNPTFFAGISQFKSQEDYSRYLNQVVSDQKTTYEIFANNIYAVGHINAVKNKHLNRGMIFFSLAIFFELAIIISMYIHLTQF